MIIINRCLKYWQSRYKLTSKLKSIARSRIKNKLLLWDRLLQQEHSNTNNTKVISIKSLNSISAISTPLIKSNKFTNLCWLVYCIYYFLFLIYLWMCYEASPFLNSRKRILLVIQWNSTVFKIIMSHFNYYFYSLKSIFNLSVSK